jgi:hypothetical protein
MSLRMFLFLCDYVFLEGRGMVFNRTVRCENGQNMPDEFSEIIGGRTIRWVCGWDYVSEF